MDKLFLSVLNMSLTASYVIAAVMLVRLFLKKAPKAISYALWAVVGFRLVFPFSFESVFSLLPFKAVPIPADIAVQQIPRVDSGIRVVDNVVSGVLPAGTPTASVNPLQIWLAAGMYLWLAGIAAMLIYSIMSIVLLKRRLNGATLTQDNIYKADNLKTPFVLGLFRPKIYIPAGLTEEEKRYIILHEQTHIRRHDHMVKFLAFFILCLHWFNPFAWTAFLLMSADMEMSCDERVLKEIGGETKKAYSMSLLSLAAERRIIGGSPLAFGEGNIKGRIKNVLNFKRPAFWVLILSVAAVILAVVCLLTNPVKGLELPDAASVLSMEMEQFNARASLGSVVVTDSGDVETVLSTLSGARKTLRQSVNDVPAQSNYLKVRLVLQGEGEPRTLFLYTEGNNYYVEAPYIGVYRGNGDASVSIYTIYNRGSEETERTVAQNIDIIMSSPLTSSNSQDYIDAHRAEYDAILALDEKALPYLFSEFEKGGQTGLKGHIMEGLCRTILGGEDISYANSDPQDWYDHYRALTLKLYQKNSAEFLRNSSPKAYILLPLIGDGYDTLPVMISWAKDGERHTLADYQILMNVWNGVRTDRASHGQVFYKQFAENGSSPQPVPEGARISVEFYRNPPDEITAVRDSFTYDRASPDAPHSNTDLSIPLDAITGDGATLYTFPVEYDGNAVLYYVLTCRWENGNEVELAFAVQK